MAYTAGWNVVPGEVATASKFSQLGANDDYLKDEVDKAVAPGCMMAYPVPTPPVGWLVCDGRAVSRSTYADLFAVLGISRGEGDGSTTFNLPNIKGRTIIGVDPADTTIDTAGKQVGAKTHVLSLREMPSHDHSGTTTTNGSHTHSFSKSMAHTDNSSRRTGANNAEQAYGFDNYVMHAAGAHNHSFTTSTRGAGEAHNNMQPSDAEYWIIKY